MKVITPVGTSIFSNYFKDGHPDERRKYMLLLEQEQKLTPVERVMENFQLEIDFLRRSILAWAKEKGSHSSAEWESMEALTKQTSLLRIHFLASDTALSLLAAEILYDVLKEHDQFNLYFDSQKDVIPGLQVYDEKRFRQEGMPNLIKRLDAVWGGWAKGVAINMTGGYKGTIPYLTIWAQVHNVPLYYKFEDTECIIKIPQAPISVDWGLFVKYKGVFNDLYDTIEDWENYKRTHNIEDDFPDCVEEITVNGETVAALNAVGQMFLLMSRNYFIVQINVASEFAKNKGSRRQIEDALRELWRRLRQHIKNLNDLTTSTLHDIIRTLDSKDDLRHGSPGKNIFIFKSTDETQIRLVYSPYIEHGELYLKLYDFKRGNFDHSAYQKEFKIKFGQEKELQFVNTPIRKEA